jgi:hypothetical protein
MPSKFSTVAKAAEAAGLAATLTAQGFADTIFLPTNEVSCCMVSCLFRASHSCLLSCLEKCCLLQRSLRIGGFPLLLPASCPSYALLPSHSH